LVLSNPGMPPEISLAMTSLENWFATISRIHHRSDRSRGLRSDTAECGFAIVKYFPSQITVRGSFSRWMRTTKRDEKQQMDQAQTGLNTESHKPQNQKHYKSHPEHLASSVAIHSRPSHFPRPAVCPMLLNSDRYSEGVRRSRCRAVTTLLPDARPLTISASDTSGGSPLQRP
jgi:hypothetical protein